MRILGLIVRRLPEIAWSTALAASLLTAPAVFGQRPADKPAAEQPPMPEDPPRDPPAEPKAAENRPAENRPAANPPAGGAGTDRKPNASARGKIRFSFERTAWRDVINLLAKEANLALHISDVPTGSFTYSDPQLYTPAEAIDRVNLFLLPKGFTLVRSGRLLSVLNLGDPRSAQQLNSLAQLVTLKELEKLDNHAVAKCFFPLGEFAAEDAVQELAALNLMMPPAVLKKTNQLLVIDTAANLRSVQRVLSAVKPSVLDNGTVMKAFSLQHADAEDVFAVARPHLGLATGEMIGIDVSLSADPQGKNLFVTGVADKVRLFEGFVKAVDVADRKMAAMAKDAKLQSHRVAGGNVDAVYNVLITLLAGKSIRLSMDESTSSIVALAPPDVQKEIAATVEQLQASDAIFEVIPLKNIDPYFAIALLEQMLEPEADQAATAAGLAASNRGFDTRFRDDRRDDRRRDDRRRDDRRWDDRRRFAPGREFSMPARFNTSKVKPPKIDADPGSRRLFVRGTKLQIEQIRQIIARLDTAPQFGGSDRLRIYPLTGKRAERVLLTTAKFWRRPNPVILFPTPQAAQAARERVVSESPQPAAGGSRPPQPPQPPPRYLTDNLRSQAPAVRCQITVRGLLVQCEDLQTLDQFEKLLQTVSGPLAERQPTPVVFYLKYAKPADALRMLAELLDGGNLAAGPSAGSLVNGAVGGGGLFGSLVTSREGTTTLISETVTVVADARLNRLIAQGSAADIERIEQYLKIVDKDNSLTTIETYGRSHVIELQHSKASVVAATLRDAYAGRIAGGPAAARGTAGTAAGRTGENRSRGDDRQRRNPDGGREGEERESDRNRDRDRDRNSTSRGRSGGAAKSQEPQVAIAVHEPSNSLIVTAPESLYKEIEALAKRIDDRNKRTISIIRSGRAPLIQTSLQNVFGAGASGSRPAGTPSSAPARGPASRPQPPRGPTPRTPAGRPR